MNALSAGERRLMTLTRAFCPPEEQLSAETGLICLLLSGWATLRKL